METHKETGLKPKDVADILGCSEYKVKQLVREKIMPHYRVGNRILFTRDSVIKWMNKQIQKNSYFRA